MVHTACTSSIFDWCFSGPGNKDPLRWRLEGVCLRACLPSLSSHQPLWKSSDPVDWLFWFRIYHGASAMFTNTILERLDIFYCCFLCAPTELAFIQRSGFNVLTSITYKMRSTSKLLVLCLLAIFVQLRLNW